MENYAIPDSSVTASSTEEPATNGRLHWFAKQGQNGGWILRRDYEQGSWFQVDFGSWTKITRIATQGCQEAFYWVAKYHVSYSYDGIFFKNYQEKGEDPKVFTCTAIFLRC